MVETVETYVNQFNLEVIASFESDVAIIHVFEGKIVYTRIKPNCRVTLDVVREAEAFMDSLDGEELYYVLFEYCPGADIDPEVRKRRASKGSVYSKLDVLVISNLAQKIIADFYMKINRPKIPTRLFYSMEKAIPWIIKRSRGKL